MSKSTYVALEEGLVAVSVAVLWETCAQEQKHVYRILGPKRIVRPGEAQAARIRTHLPSSVNAAE